MSVVLTRVSAPAIASRYDGLIWFIFDNMAAMLSRVAAQLLGTLWPAYQSYKAINSRDVDGYVCS
jgi:hypothetical protein